TIGSFAEVVARSQQAAHLPTNRCRGRCCRPTCASGRSLGGWRGRRSHAAEAELLVDQLDQVGLAGGQGLDECLQLSAIQHGQARFERWLPRDGLVDEAFWWCDGGGLTRLSAW